MSERLRKYDQMYSDGNVAFGDVSERNFSTRSSQRGVSNLVRGGAIRLKASGCQSCRDPKALCFCDICRPDGKPRRSIAEVLNRAVDLLDLRHHEPSLAELAMGVGLSAAHFQRIFKAALGISPKQYAMAVKKQYFRRTLVAEATVTDAIYAAGFNSSSRAYKCVSPLGMTLARYRAGGEGETIYYCIIRLGFGEVLVALAGQGPCAVEFGDADQLRQQLISRFYSASVHRGPPALQAMLETALSRRYQRSKLHESLPPRVRDTVLQEVFWNELYQIKNALMACI